MPAAKSNEDWDEFFARSMSVFLNGEAIREPDSRGEPVTDDQFWLLLNGHHEELGFVLPEVGGDRWEVVLDTHAPMLDEVEARVVKTGEPFDVEARSVVLLRKVF